MMPGFSEQMKDAVTVDYSRIKEKRQIYFRSLDGILDGFH